MNASRKTHGRQPATVKAVKRQNGIFATPAGSEMNVRMTGRSRVKNTVASPWRGEPRGGPPQGGRVAVAGEPAVGPRQVRRLDVQLAPVLLEDVGAAVVADGVRDPGADEVAE